MPREPWHTGITLEIRDPVHGSINIQKEIIPVIKSDFFQRLRNIKQLGFADLVFPGATHSRFIHSIGVMHVGERCLKKLFQGINDGPATKRIKKTFQLACLLHDIGHAPLSHSTELVMPPVSKLQIPPQFLKTASPQRRATHEDYGLKAISDSSFIASFKQIEEAFGVEREHIAALIRGEDANTHYFTVEGINYFPILHQLVSGELDCDRMDYLLRDSYFCGVSYGNYDLDWLIDNLEVVIKENCAFLGISERAIITFNDFLLSRYHMFLMVYFHYKSVCLEQLLYKYFETSPEEYSLPADIEKYIDYDDDGLMKTIKDSQNKYAKAIVKNRIPTKIYESFNHHQFEKLKHVQHFLDAENIEYIKCSSRGELSRYHAGHQCPYSIQVVRTLYRGKKSYSDIRDVTDLFQQFKKHHEVARLHCEIEHLSHAKKDRLMELVNS